MSVNELNAAERIRGIMTEKGLTQKDLSELLDVSQPAVSLYLQGRMPPADVLYRIAQLGGTSVEWLLTGSTVGNMVAREAQPLYGNQHLLLKLWDQVPPNIQRDILRLLRGIADLQHS